MNSNPLAAELDPPDPVVPTSGGRSSINRPRAGAYALSLLAVPLNASVLRALSGGPTPLADLRAEIGAAPATTMRTHMRALVKIGVIERRRKAEFPGSMDYELADPGRDLLAVLDALSVWLARAPRPESAEPGSEGARNSIKALIEGWSTTMLRALASQPLSLTELNLLITRVTYPSLERRLGAMRAAGQVEPTPSVRSRGTPYAVTTWLRRSVAPIAAAARWEREHLMAPPDEPAPISPIDIEAALLLSVPLLRLPDGMSGVCRLVVEMRARGENKLVGVTVTVAEGRIASCIARLGGSVDGSALGSTTAWLEAIIDHRVDRIEVEGDSVLMGAVLDGFHRVLFA